jgi:predicted helicase
MLDFYNQQVDLFVTLNSNDKNDITKIIDNNPSKISWTRSLKKDLYNKKKHNKNVDSYRLANYRPFCKQNLYYDKSLIESPGLNIQYFPEKLSHNRIISIPGVGGSKEFTTLMTDSVTDYQVMFNNQCFPLFYYEVKQQVQGSLFDATSESKYIRRDGVSDFIWERAKKQYGKSVTKEDIFYYVYGILHSPDYRETFANDLKKMLPRIPLVDNPKDFWAFSKAGRKLAELHINYESVEPYNGAEVVMPQDHLQMDAYEFYKVTKLRFPKKDQKETIIYNSRIKINNIPEKAYEYVVNGKSAIDWIMDRYQVSVDKKSGIKNDANDWSREVENPSYILDLILSIINVSVQTVDIVESLPKLEFD